MRAVNISAKDFYHLDELKKENKMANEIPIFTTGIAADKTVAGVVEPVAPDQDAATIVQQVASDYRSPDGAPADVTPTGRPRRKYGPRRRKTVAGSPAEGEAVPGADAGFRLDKAIVEKTAGTVLGTVDRIVQNKVVKTAKLLGADADLAQEMAFNAGLTTDEGKLMAELTGIIFEKYGLLTGWAPEALLAILVTEYGIRVSMVMRKLNEMAAELKRARVTRVETVKPAEEKPGG